MRPSTTTAQIAMKTGEERDKDGDLVDVEVVGEVVGEESAAPTAAGDESAAVAAVGELEAPAISGGQPIVLRLLYSMKRDKLGCMGF